MKPQTTTETLYFVKILVQKNRNNYAPLLYSNSLKVAEAIIGKAHGLIISKTIFLN